ncbi:ParB/RepB/Spo0J family partition protein [Dysosmobacter sp.]|uniref:ParB/RepB/Spo0J family partition protein n=1 Tax=Dysosmobacter sp. TaxID=2591382 RepID=UPI003A923BD9
MAEEKKNPLIGAFRSPPPKEAPKAPPDAKVAESVKPSTADKPILAAQKPAEPVKPVIPPKAEETKAAPKPNGTATPVKPTEKKPAAKPPVPAKAEDAKAAVKPAVPAKPEEAKSTAKPEEKKPEKSASVAAVDAKPAKAEEKKPVTAPAEKKSEEKKPEEKPPAKQEEKKADVPAKSEDKKPVEDKPAPKAEVAEKKEQPPEKETDAEGIPKDFKLNIVGEGALGSVVMLPVDKIDDFEGHPFPVQDDKDMLDLVESVRKFGVLEPVTVSRSSKDPSRYEMVAGHRRKHSCVLAGVAQIPAIVRDMDRDSAIIYMVDSNLKRENISPMVKARAYSMKLEAMKRKAGRPTKAQVEAGYKPMRADEQLAQQTGESRATIQRLTRLTKLEPELQNMVEEKKLPVNTAADISYLKPQEQKTLADAIKREDKVPSGTQAAELKKDSQAGKLTTEKIEQTVAPTKREMSPPLKVTFSEDELRAYFPKKDTTVGDVKRVVFEALDLRQKALDRQKARAEQEKAAKKATPGKAR